MHVQSCACVCSGPWIGLGVFVAAYFAGKCSECFCDKKISSGEWACGFFLYFCLPLIASTVCCAILLVRAIIARGFPHIFLPSHLPDSFGPADLTLLSQQISVLCTLLLGAVGSVIAVLEHCAGVGRADTASGVFFELKDV